MSRIFGRINDAVARSGRKVLIGCESAAAEPFLPYLLFNDLRYSINLRFAIPVPAYAYLNHEYINNFMGNQNSVRECVDYGRSPLNLHQRIAYSFVAGDMLTVVLRGGGKIAWEWGTTWEAPGPDHDSVVQLIRSLNAWRVGVGKPFLVYGRSPPSPPAAGCPATASRRSSSTTPPKFKPAIWPVSLAARSSFTANHESPLNPSPCPPTDRSRSASSPCRRCSSSSTDARVCGDNLSREHAYPVEAARFRRTNQNRSTDRDRKESDSTMRPGTSSRASSRSSARDALTRGRTVVSGV